MFFHALAVVIALVGIVVLAIMGEPGALRQLVFFLICIAVAVVMAAGTLCLLIG